MKNIKTLKKTASKKECALDKSKPGLKDKTCEKRDKQAAKKSNEQKW
jgi:hypothetical protein